MTDAAVVKDHQEPVEPAQERAVVRDRDDGARETVQRVLERLRGVDVEVVGRLVEQQQVVALQLEQSTSSRAFSPPLSTSYGRRAASAARTARARDIAGLHVAAADAREHYVDHDPPGEVRSRLELCENPVETRGPRPAPRVRRARPPALASAASCPSRSVRSGRPLAEVNLVRERATSPSIPTERRSSTRRAESPPRILTMIEVSDRRGRRPASLNRRHRISAASALRPAASTWRAP